MKKTKFKVVLLGTFFLILVSVGIGLIFWARKGGKSVTASDMPTLETKVSSEEEWHQVETWSLRLLATGEPRPLDVPDEESEDPYLVFSVYIMAGTILALVSTHLKYSKLPKPVIISKHLIQ